MNERIKELAEQAGDDWDHTVETDKEFLKKFAELIVKECVDYAFSDDQERAAMLRHFGVEE